MDSGKLVVARFEDGRLIKGRLEEFRVEKGSLRIYEEDAAPTTVEFRGLKALFFVKSLEGDASHAPRMRFPEHNIGGVKTWVRFRDGEEMAGWQIDPRPLDEGVFLYPTDVSCNIEKAYVPRASAAEILCGKAAEAAAAEYRRRRPMSETFSAPEDWGLLIRR